MNAEMKMKFRTMFEEQRKNLMYSQNIIDESFHTQPEDLLDEADLTSAELDQSMRMRLRNRETLFIKKIDDALGRIAAGTFGTCESCDEDIELRRLEARPTATLCVGCKEEEERLEHVHIDGHRAKSLGNKIKLA